MAVTVSTESAKRALLDHLIDDASVFPPRQLPMRLALRHHARHAESAYAWIGGRFVLPASRADEFAAVRAAAEPIALTVILDAAIRGAKGDTVRADLHRVERLRELPGVSVEGLELQDPRRARRGRGAPRDRGRHGELRGGRRRAVARSGLRCGLARAAGGERSRSSPKRAARRRCS